MILKEPEDSDLDFKEMRGQVVGWYKKASQKRFKRLPSGYVWDRWIGTVYLLVVLSFLFFVANSYNYALDYYKCGSDIPDYVGPGQAEMCKNPFYKPGNAWKGQEFLPPGEYGTKPGHLFYSAIYMPVVFLLLAVGLNHLIHNRSSNTEEEEE